MNDQEVWTCSILQSNVEDCVENVGGEQLRKLMWSIILQYLDCVLLENVALQKNCKIWIAKAFCRSPRVVSGSCCLHTPPIITIGFFSIEKFYVN